MVARTHRHYFHQVLDWYRAAPKRLGILHKALYCAADSAVIPLMERLAGFHTYREDPVNHRLEMLLGAYELGTVRVVRRLLRPGMICLDIGANVGYYTRLFSSLVGDDGRVVAFEPHPEALRLLRRNTARLGNVEVVPMGAADQQTTMRLYDALAGVAASSFYVDEEARQRSLRQPELAPRIREGAQVRSFEVPVTTVDTAVERLHVPRVDFVKMDVEGGEVPALRGMRNLINRSDGLTLVVECAPRKQHMAGLSVRQFVQVLHSLGFADLWRIGDDGSLSPITELDLMELESLACCLDTCYVNLLARAG